ncbi:MAG: HAMP domain-containing sensor histidine kinase, partial [Acidimicrobiia bacterium]
RLGDGDFTVRAEASGVPEVDAVSAALETTAVRLDRMLTRERSFSEDASHQLRTPLTSLRINLEAASLDPTRDLDAVLAAAVDDVDRLDRTIDDLLTLAREAPAPHADTEVAEVLRRLETGWRPEVSAGRSLRLVVAPDLPKVLISDRAVRQILDVLVDNARRHGAGEIVVAARPAGSGAVIEVSDEGTGVIAEPERIFERRSSTVGSHGIGLALARALAEAEGARLVLRRPGPQPVFALLMSPGPDHDEPED